MQELWQKRLLLIAAAWNLLGGTSALFDPKSQFEKLYTASIQLDDPLQLFFYRCAWINVMAWGLAYVLGAFLPGSRRALFIGGGAGKLVYFFAFLAMYRSGVGKSGLLAAGFVDLLFALMFFMAARPAHRAAKLAS